MPSPPSSVIITIDDSSDDEVLQSTRQRVPVPDALSDGSRTKELLTCSLPAAVITSANYSKEKEEKGSDKSVIDVDNAGEQTTNFKVADSNGQMFSDTMSFSELQAQQRELEMLQAQANRACKPVSQTSLFDLTVGSKRKVHNAGLMPHSDELQSSVLMKTTSRSPLNFDSSSSSDDSSFSSSLEDTIYTAPAHLAKSMSLRDVVAHERELVRKRNKNAINTSQNTPKNKKRRPSKQSGSESPLVLSRKANNSFVDEPEWSESEQTDDDDDDDEYEDPPYQPELVLEKLSPDPDHGMSRDIKYVLRKPKSQKDKHVSRRRCDQNVKSGKKRKAVVSKPPSKVKDKNGKSKSRSSSATSDVQHSKLTTQAGPLSTKLTQQRSAQDTVLHNTMWRNVYFDTAATNLLPLDSEIAPPFDSAYDQPLLTYDVDRELRSNYQQLSELRESTQRFSEPKQDITQEDMDIRVVGLIEQELPRLRSCHQRKAKAILAEARAKIKVYLASLDLRKTQAVFVREESKRLSNVSILDKSLLNQLKREEPTQRSLKYFTILGETAAVEESLFPHDVNQLPKVRPLNICTAYIGLKANIRVEDDPILRYKPYFGEDDDGADIDQAWYDAIEPKSSNLSIGLDGEVNEYLLRFVIRECGTTDKVFAALKKVTGFEQAYSDYNELKKLDDSICLAARRIKEAKELIKRKPEEIPLAKILALEPSLRDDKDSQKTLVERLSPPPTYFDSNMLKNHAYRGYGLGLRSSIECSELLVTYRDMFCRMCYDYHCLEHGIQHPLPSCRADPINPPLHLSAVAFATLAKKQHDQKTKLASTSSESCESTVVTVDCTEDSGNSTAQDNFQREDTVHGDVYVHDSIVAGHSQGETDFEVATDEKVTISEESNEARRSRRALTRMSSLASQNMIKQVIQPSGKKLSRPCREQIYPTVVDKSEYLDDSHYAPVCAFLKKSQQPGDKCSEECWKAETATASDYTTDELNCCANLLNVTEQTLSRKLRLIVGDSPCVISNMMKSTTCKEVGSFLELERRSQLCSSSSTDKVSDVSTIHNGRKRGRAMNIRSINNRIMLSRTKNNRGNREYEPCNHQGACGSTGCSCMQRDHTCDRACSCSRDCPNRFPGCRCSLGNCRTKACPCFIAARECNPDLCVTCGASEVPALVFDAKRRNMPALDLGICCNVNILRGLHKKIGVAYSTTHGWGAFALEPIKRGEFIYEYHGALLSQDEAERRGSIYDKMTISFLFDVNDDSVVDAIRKGNKSKFANHSTTDKKCKGKIITVGGEHRISIWAEQDIAKGEELFFDYGYQGETAPDWSQLRIKGQGPQKKRVKRQDGTKH
ncbi:hypothetical protein PsorP6_000239 [Peronosclerospora sorghi]|uniref:Uncharacterized protein n=1 Tax=Peronosclerospora sorghi TaxID=230839 RepID=A0ACC0WR08_9STRA|nr:hypothetical protein PsorP6_000239 [Peronosclerospora sorghi]